MKRSPLLFALLGFACSPSADIRDQWVLRVSTDAPVPELGDRLLVEVLDADLQAACTGCRRMFGLETSTDVPLSFGVADFGASAYVRVRLFRSALVGFDGFPQGEALIDQLGKLPPADGRTAVEFALSTDCFGIPVSGRQSCDPNAERVDARVLPEQHEPAQAGSSPWFASVPCTGDVPEGMACHPGGAFILGSPTLPRRDGGLASEPERLVRLSPFALDIDEVSVGTVRRLLSEGKVNVQPVVRAASLSDPASACTFMGLDTAENDAFPVNCITLEDARGVCEALDKRLPTEAEWEYAAGNMSAETEFPWGSDADVCEHAVVGRARSAFEAGSAVDLSNVCRVNAAGSVVPWGPRPSGSSQDVTQQGVRDLAGNVSEFVSGAFARYGDGCWNAGPILVDPTCDVEGDASNADGATLPLRGGAWDSARDAAHAAWRHATQRPGASPYVGFRCAVSFPVE